MHEGIWTPRMTVSAVIERDGKYLLVEEFDEDGKRVFNQPAGHLEDNESLQDAVVREVLEETGYAFSPSALTGMYRWKPPQSDLTFMRVNFIGSIGSDPVSDTLDKDIIATHWMNQEELSKYRLRSQLVTQCIEDYLNKPHHDLSILIDA